jgi:DNA-binding NarL/FixJ family response regulator
MLEKILLAKEIHSKVIHDPRIALKEIRKKIYYVVLLDIIMPDMHGLDVLGEIAKNYPGTKVIIMTGYADKAVAIKALRMGAYDFLEKPIAMDLLCHSVQRALDTRKTEIEYARALDALKQKNQELLEVNDTLSELMRVVEMIRKTTETRIIQQIRTLIIPIMENLKEREPLERYEPQFAMLIRYIEDIASGLATDLQANYPFSPMQLRVALMVKSSMKNQEIAQHLDISLETVKAHRRSIRKKLGLTGTKNSLHTYLGASKGKPRA